jgi:hypothetical protein
VVESDSESGCRNCSWASVCAWPWTAAWGVEGQQYLFDADRRIQIADFSAIRLETGAFEPFSEKKWTPTADLSAFASILFEIAIGRPGIASIGAGGGLPVPPAVSCFVSRMAEDAQLPDSDGSVSFTRIVGRLKENRFEIMAGVDSDEVSAFVAWLKSAEQTGKWE